MRPFTLYLLKYNFVSESRKRCSKKVLGCMFVWLYLKVDYLLSTWLNKIFCDGSADQLVFVTVHIKFIFCVCNPCHYSAKCRTYYVQYLLQ